MLLYTKIVEENGKPVRKVYGTVGNVPTARDEEVILKDADGDIIEAVEGDSYVIDNSVPGGIVRLSDGKFVAVSVADPEGEPVTVIPNADWEPTEKEVVSIAISNPAEKLAYTVGEELDLAGLEVEATCKDGDIFPAEDFTTDPAEGTVLNTEGNVTVTITFEEKTTSFVVTVAAQQAEEPEPEPEPVEPDNGN